MCGIFGIIRNTEARHPERASAAFVELGKHAVERGRDSSGFALTTPNNTEHSVTGPTRHHVDSFETKIDNVHIIKDTLPFHDLWNDGQHLPLLAEHRVAIGHTRWATQGKRDALTNASPLVVGSIVGTHNGDIDTTSVPGKYILPAAHGSTDTEVLYQALHRDRRDRRKITDTLGNVEGRAALAWVDRHKTDRVYLARAALSPLSLAWDAEGNLYWASNPRWFRDIDRKFDGALGFHDILIVQEGTLLTVSLADASPDIADVRRFTPKCRPSDARLSDAVVWRGFDESDREADKAQQRHEVAPRRSTYPFAAYGTSAAKSAKAARKSGGGLGGWDMTQPGYAAVNSGNQSTLPDYHDRLDGLGGQVFSHSNDDPWEMEDQNSSIWSDEAELNLDHEEEAMIAANRWFDHGADDSILGVLRSASMPSEIEALMEEFDLTSLGAFNKFRDLLQTWSMEKSH